MALLLAGFIDGDQSSMSPVWIVLLEVYPTPNCVCPCRYHSRRIDYTGGTEVVKDDLKATF